MNESLQLQGEGVRREAIHQIRLGELGKGVEMLVGVATAEVRRGLPSYSETIKRGMESRRAEAAAALRVVAQKLLEEARQVVEG